MTRKFYEAQIKDVILQKSHIFLDNRHDRHTILFEKGLDLNSCIADCLIFTENKLIGIEIKTEYDSTKRLNKQLNSYSKVCDEVYVLCGDNHADKVEELLDKNGHKHVGVIGYEIYKDEAIVGVYRKPTKSPSKSVVTMYMSLMWKEELLNLAGAFKRQINSLEEFGYNVASADSRGATGINGISVQSNVSKRMRKPDIAKYIVQRLGEQKANSLLCNIYISHKLHVEKQLKYYHFKEEL